MDNFVLSAIVKELAGVFPAGIDRVYTPGPMELAIKLKPSRKGFLLFKLNPTNCLFLYGTRSPGKSVLPSRAAERLKALLEGGEIKAVEKDGWDRTIVLRIRPYLSKETTLAVKAELFPPRPAIYVLDAGGRVVCGMGPGSERIPKESLYAPIRSAGGPGLPEMDAQCLAEALRDDTFEGLNGPDEIAKALSRRLPGIGRLAAREAVHRAASPDPRNLVPALAGVIAEGLAGTPLYLVCPAEGDTPYLSAIAMSHEESATVTSFDSSLDASHACLSTVGPLLRMSMLRKPVVQRLSKHRARIEKALAKVGKEAEGSKNALAYRQWGDLILASGIGLKEHKAQLKVDNLYDQKQGKVTIPLNPTLTLFDNAQKFFKKATKAERAKKRSAKRLEELDVRLNALEEIAVAVEHATEPSELLELASELKQAFGVRANPAKGKKVNVRHITEARPQAYRSSDGLEILVGKGARDNDRLTFKVAAATDFWLHAASASGAHVVIRNPRRLSAPPPATLREAAALAAYFSKRCNDGLVEVHYTTKRHVRKPKGRSAGLVTLREFKTVRVRPDSGEKLQIGPRDREDRRERS